MMRRGIRMGIQQSYHGPHWLKDIFRGEKITLWMLRNLTGVPESRLSRYFNGIDPMPPDLEKHLNKLSYALTGKLDEYEEIQTLVKRACRLMEEKEKKEEASFRENIERRSEEEETDASTS